MDVNATIEKIKELAKISQKVCKNMNLNRNLENLDIKIFQDFKKKNPTKSLCYP